MKIQKKKYNDMWKGLSKTQRHSLKSKLHGSKRFLTQKDISSMKYDEAIAFSSAKRDKTSIAGVRQHPCGCGTEGCNITIPLMNSNIKIHNPKKQPTKHPKKLESNMFSGKII